MYSRHLHDTINLQVQKKQLSIAEEDNGFYVRLLTNVAEIKELYDQLYAHLPDAEEKFTLLTDTIISAYRCRPPVLKERDKQKDEHWFLSNQIAGMSLYVDRFAGHLKKLPDKLDYLQELGVNFLHLMPIFESPENESDGGYAVSDFRNVDPRFGTLQDLKDLQQELQHRSMYLMLDIVLNHTSHRHEWAMRARKGEKKYQDYYYFFDDRSLPDRYDQTMPEIFPESAPGNFTYIKDCHKWVMTVFHNYQWDLNYSNPMVLVEMLDTVFFYANLGVDVLRIDAPAFIWKQLGTTCQNLPQAHSLLQLIKLCVQISAPGMALLGEAIVSPAAIMKYFGTGKYVARECDFAYNATHMALQWDALATGDTRIMLAAQHVLSQKPYGTSWITYTRCHDDIGLGYDDYMIEQAGFNAHEHRKFLKNYFSGKYKGSPAKGALFSFNPKTEDARISGTLASLCGLETAISNGKKNEIDLAIQKILLMQAHSFFIGGIPMLFYGDEAGYTNDYSYLSDSGKNYDNRWMHRPLIDWNKNALTSKKGTIENTVYESTKKLLLIRKTLSVFADKKNLTWLTPHNIHVAGYIRAWENDRVYCLFNFSSKPQRLTWYAFKEHGAVPEKLFDHWKGRMFTIGKDHEYLDFAPYEFFLLEAKYAQ